MQTQLQAMQAHYVRELGKLLSAEEKLLRALPGVIENAASPQAREVFQNHLKETEEHVLRLERILGDYCRTSNFVRADLDHAPSPHAARSEESAPARAQSTPAS